MPDDCYWYSQNTCWLEKGKLPEEWIYKWIRKIPSARAGILNCAMDPNSHCDAVPEEYIEQAENVPDIKSARQQNDEWQSWIRNFVDHHRLNFSIKRTNSNEDDS
jgi:hypothetical protein